MSDDNDLQSNIKRIKKELKAAKSSPQADLSGDGAIAQEGGKAVGRDGILIEGDVYFGVEPRKKILDDDTPAPGTAPFKGLRHFDVTDAPLFFGRTGLTELLLEHVRTKRFLAVVGASGSGKSSIVRAGVVASLQNQPGWRIHIITPTASPLETLALALTSESESVSAAKTLRDDMRNDPESLHLYTRRLMADDSKARMLLVVDQFEELFTLCRDSAERVAYVNNLLTAVSEERQGSLTVILTLRADFYHHCMQFRPLLIALPKYQVNVGIMTAIELREAIIGPAEKGDWNFEPGLVDLMLRDVSNEPGALPLLSHALLATWLRRRGRTMTLASYSEVGGVQGAISRTADDTYGTLSPTQKQIARNVFLRLTELGESTQDTRRRVQLEELKQLSEDENSVAKVLELLADARLVTTGEDSVEVAHEALIREWPTLRSWLDENRESLRIHRHLTETALEWERNQRDVEDLYRGSRRAHVLEWSAGHVNELSPLEKEYIKACHAEQKRERRGRRLRMSIVGTIPFVLLIWLVLTGQLNRFVFRPLTTAWITVPAGIFSMGSEIGYLNERPIHLVYIDTFDIGQFEVTNRQYSQCVKAGVCSPPRNDKYGLSALSNHPVTDVSWYDATTFCEWQDPNGRLPTEAEWEKAALGASGILYPWGEDLDCDHANYSDDQKENKCKDGTTPVGSYEIGKSLYGAYDMIGNAFEWVEDEYQAYPGNHADDPNYGGTYRVLRGGSWGYNFQKIPTATLRIYNNPWDSNVGIFGIRCARGLPAKD